MRMRMRDDDRWGSLPAGKCGKRTRILLSSAMSGEPWTGRCRPVKAVKPTSQAGAGQVRVQFASFSSSFLPFFISDLLFRPFFFPASFDLVLSSPLPAPLHHPFSQPMSFARPSLSSLLSGAHRRAVASFSRPSRFLSGSASHQRMSHMVEGQSALRLLLIGSPVT